MSRELAAPGGVILGWVLANSLGVAAIGASILILPFLDSTPGRLASTLIIGLPIGLAQWIALRRVAAVSLLWILTVPAGLHLGLLAINGPMRFAAFGFLDDESLLALTAACTIIGMLVGLAQCLFLRVRFAKSLVWPLSSGLGLGLGIALILATNLINQSGIASIIVVLLVYAIVTGLVVSWLPGRHGNTESNLVSAT